MDPRKLAAIYERNDRVRREGTANLLVAAHAAGVSPFVVQSMATWYRPRPRSGCPSTPQHLARLRRGAFRSCSGISFSEDHWRRGSRRCAGRQTWRPGRGSGGSRAIQAGVRDFSRR
jgi:hypothetical protein